MQLQIESTSTPACKKKSQPVTTRTPLLKKFGEKVTKAVIENTITSSANNFTDQETAKSDECMLSDDVENYFVPIKKPTIKEIIKACRPVASSENSEKSAAASQENEVNCSSLEQSVVNDSGLHGDFPTIINTDVEDLDVSGVVDQVDCVDDPEDSDYTLSETEVSESEDSEISDKENKHVEKGADVFTFSADEEDESEEEQETIDRVYVKETQKSNGGERLYDSRHACLYCGLMQPKLSRHLLTHIVEEEVKKVKDLALKSKERKHLLKALRLKGDFYHNIKVLKTGGEMIVARRPPKGVKSQPSEYLPCKYCYAFLHQAQLSRHCRNCSFKDMKSCEQENIIKQSELLIYPNRAIPGASLDLEEFVIRKMKKDELTELVKKDFIIVTYGSFLISGKGRRATGEVSQRMRILARLLQKLQELRQNVDGGLIAFIKPQYFDDVCECTKLLAGYKSQNADGEMAPCFETPSLPLKLGYTLDSVCNLLHGYGLRTNDDVLIKNAINFLKLYQTEWPVRISSASLWTLAENKFNKTDVLPLTSDLLKLKVFCEKEIVRLCADLKKNVTVDVWRQLAEIVITRLTVFNKRRGNEPASILLKRYAARNDREKIMHDDIADSLSPIEKKLIDRLEIVHVRGKRGRQVPTLLTADCVAAIDLLVKKREKVGVAAGNKYLFPTPTRQSLNPLRGYQCINEVVKRVEGLEKPDLVKSTKLRKYIATVNVHKEYYRLHDSAIELSKVSRLLLAIDSGNGKELVGRSLKEITLNDLPSPVDEDLNEEDVNEEDVNEEDVEHFSDHENTAVSETRKIVKIIAPRKSNRNWTQWSKEASAVVLKRCHSFIVGDLLPGKALCEKIIEENQGLLQGRSWRNIKDFVLNHKRNVSKKMSEK
ncbi:uncharacterized protein LOC130648660 [Hydractinia symbiolongicarpus]|uniref:uncharacterized protein LOC130648660 n=1 Tax=Hydractinia symbiolongicarpus TaxID=13093 RepID=UPI002551C688|nr:uncharacterized protein LOC130648660 [Hydractinia symbiolongicarpus]